MTKQTKEFFDFKIKQFASTTGFDYKQENAKEKLNKVVSPYLKQWAGEIIASGVRV